MLKQKYTDKKKKKKKKSPIVDKVRKKLLK